MLSRGAARDNGAVAEGEFAQLTVAAWDEGGVGEGSHNRRWLAGRRGDSHN